VNTRSSSPWKAERLRCWKSSSASADEIGIGRVEASDFGVSTRPRTAVSHIRRAFPFFSNFDGYVYSYEHRAMKPDPKFYAVVERMTSCRGKQILYIDDRPENAATGLVRDKCACAAGLTGAFSLLDSTIQFAAVSVGGIAVGILLAQVYIAIHRRLHDPFIEVLTVLTILTVMGITNHMGWEMFPTWLVKGRAGKWLITASHHQLHHQRNKCNYGLYFRFWDRLCGTDGGLGTFERRRRARPGPVAGPRPRPYG